MSGKKIKEEEVLKIFFETPAEREFQKKFVELVSEIINIVFLRLRLFSSCTEDELSDFRQELLLKSLNILQKRELLERDGRKIFNLIYITVLRQLYSLLKKRDLETKREKKLIFDERQILIEKEQIQDTILFYTT